MTRLILAPNTLKAPSARRLPRLIVTTTLIVPLLAQGDVVVLKETVDGHVNIRIAPEGGAEVIGALNAGASLPYVQASGHRWREVRLDDGRSGYISQTYTEVIPEPPATVGPPLPADATEPAIPEVVADETPVAEPTPEAEPTDEAIEDEPVQTVVAERSEEAEEPVARDVPVVSEAVEDAVAEQLPHEQPVIVDERDASFVGTPNYVVKFKDPTTGGDSSIFDDGINVGIGTLTLTQATGGTGYVMHNLSGTMTIGAGSEDRITIDRNGNVGIGMNRPDHPLEMRSGAHVTAGGVWTNASSADYKENVTELELQEALDVLAELSPVRFNYKADRGEEYLGFIAEDVPDLVAIKDRRGLSPMDIVAVLTRVLQEQQQRIEALEARLDER